jgi:glycosyltransferase involved in cell wall biosynthesis
MPRITALLHTKNDGLRLGRCLETLWPCDEVVIIDHGSQDSTLQVAREYGATVVTSPEYVRLADANWILCLHPRESLTESLAASLYEWKSRTTQGSAPAFSMFLREETARGWIENAIAQTRLVPGGWSRWQGEFPAQEPSALTLEGNILRFAMP